MGLEERLRLLRREASPAPEPLSLERGAPVAVPAFASAASEGTAPCLPTHDGATACGEAATPPAKVVRGYESGGKSVGEKADLSERLRRLFTAERRPRPLRVPDEEELAEALEARIFAPGVLAIEHRVSLVRLPGTGGHIASDLPALMDGQVGGPDGWRFLDTETSGLAGGTGTWAFLCGLARIEGRDLVLRQYLLARLDAELAYLDILRAELEQARLLVSYNGKAFDVPLLTTRLRLAGMRVTLDATPHLDLLFPVRRAFASRWPDCRLSTAETRLLALKREGDLPGAVAPAAWLAWLRQGETATLAGVVAHNRRDLVSLPALIPPLALAYRDPAARGADVLAVARHHLRRGDTGEALALMEANRARLDALGLLALARLHRRLGQWEAALAIWEPLAAQGEPEALESLAKHLEHRAGDYPRALALARRLPPSAERERRCRRLSKRLRLLALVPGVGDRHTTP